MYFYADEGGTPTPYMVHIVATWRILFPT